MTPASSALRWGSAPVDTRGASLPALKASFLTAHAPASGVVCEIGSGEGKFLRTLAAVHPGLVLHGCDVRSPREERPEYEFRMIDEDRLPYEDASVDAVLIFDVLEHVADPARILGEAARILKRDGRLLAFVPVEGEPVSFYEMYRRLLGRDLYVGTKHHVQSFTHGGLRAILAPRFVIEKRRYAYHALGQLMDSSFFAAAKLRAVSDFWSNDNVYYAPEGARPGVVARGLNVALQIGNAAAFVESTLLARVRTGSTGELLVARHAPAVHISQVARFEGDADSSKAAA